MTISQYMDVWDLGIVSVSASEDRDGWHMVETQGRQCILKIYQETHRDLEHITQGLELQSYAAVCGLATSEILPTRTGQMFCRTSDAVASLEVALNSRTDEISITDWRDFGRVVAQLHALPVPPNIKPSRLEPEATKSASIDAIQRNARSLSRASRYIVDALIDRITRVDPTKKCDRVLIHSDLCWANVIRTIGGGLSVIDFEGGGTAPAVMDLAEVTTQLCTGPSGSGPLNIPAANAFFGGYCADRAEVDIDIDLLTYAHAFHELYFLADALVRGDHSFVERMDRRLRTWDDGILADLDAIIQSSKNS